VSESVSPNTTGENSISLTADATVERVQVRIYTGAELDLELEPVVRTNSGNERPIVKLNGKSVLDGDDDFYEFVPSKPVQDNDEIVIKHENKSGTTTLDYRVNVDVDYRNGLRSVANRILDGVSL